MNIVCEIAPAKVNLTLEIIGKREDGYHELNSIMQTIDLCDVLTFWKNGWIHIEPEYRNLPHDDAISVFNGKNHYQDNLVFKAAELLKKETGYPGGAFIQLRKNIPFSSGLGGGSSDAAATLRGLNKLWGLGLSRKELAGIGSKIGSDIAFFIYGGTCLVKGRGEQVTPLKSFPERWLLVMPIPMGIVQKTKKLYSYIKPSHYSNGDFTTALLKKIDQWHCLEGGLCPSDPVSEYLFNTFEIVYNNGNEEFGQWKEYFEKLDTGSLHLAGSGPAIYYISDSENDVKEFVSNNLSSGDIIKYIARTVP